MRDIQRGGCGDEAAEEARALLRGSACPVKGVKFTVVHFPEQGKTREVSLKIKEDGEIRLSEKESISKDYMLYGSVYVTFAK